VQYADACTVLVPCLLCMYNATVHIPTNDSKTIYLIQSVWWHSTRWRPNASRSLSSSHPILLTMQFLTYSETRILNWQTHVPVTYSI